MIEQGLKLLAHHDLDGWTKGGEGMAIKVMKDGRRFLYIAHHSKPHGVSIVDVTEPSRPKLAGRIPMYEGQGRTNSLSLHEDTLLVACETNPAPATVAGMHTYDVSDPAKPRLLSFFDTSGPFSVGTHFVCTPDGEFAYLSTGAADFEPATGLRPVDDQFFMIVDIRDRSKPREHARWWLPGQRKEDGITLERHTGEQIDQGFRVHHVLVYPQRPDRAYLGYVDAGIVILDIADKAKPKLVTQFDFPLPSRGYTHTVVPLFERKLLLIAEEASGRDGDDAYDWPKRVWIVDAAKETDLRVLSHLPDPVGVDEMRKAGGRIGAHNIHENEPAPGTAQLTNTVAATLFSAGIRLYDITTPAAPVEFAAFVPETPAGQRGPRLNDVFVEDRGIIHAIDRVGGGLYVLEYTGTHPLS